MAILRASARRSGNSFPWNLTHRSFAPDGTIAHRAGPAWIWIAKSFSLRITACFLPVIFHRLPLWDTVTGGAPQSSRGRDFPEGCAATDRQNVNSATSSIVFFIDL